MLFKHEVLASLDSPLPVEEEALAVRIQHTKAKARQDLSRVYCASSEPWKEVRSYSGFRVFVRVLGLRICGDFHVPDLHSLWHIF